MMGSINILIEGKTDEPVVIRLLNYVGLEVGTVYGRKGKPYVLGRLPNYNQAARYMPWFVVIDLDMDTECPSEAIAKWLPNPANGMCCRIAVRSIEAWLMADREKMAEFLHVPLSKIPYNPEIDPNPKNTLINIARQSHHKDIRDDIVPRSGSGAKVGPLYTARLTEFTEQFWRPDFAANHSTSVRRCIAALSKLST
jgi:hypothetical protein